ncbi:hypothetical protein [Nocardia amamiensis]|nr:hypothetical protein [Nocardia amamiensis]
MDHPPQTVDIEITRGEGQSITIAARGLPEGEVTHLLHKALDG